MLIGKNHWVDFRKQAAKLQIGRTPHSSYCRLATLLTIINCHYKLWPSIRYFVRHTVAGSINIQIPVEMCRKSTVALYLPLALNVDKTVETKSANMKNSKRKKITCVLTNSLIMAATKLAAREVFTDADKGLRKVRGTTLSENKGSTISAKYSHNLGISTRKSSADCSTSKNLQINEKSNIFRSI